MKPLVREWCCFASAELYVGVTIPGGDSRRLTPPRFPLRHRSSTPVGRSGPSARISPSSGMVSTQPAGGGRRFSGGVTPSTSSGLRTTGTSGRDPAGRFWDQRSPARRETAPRFPLRRRSSTTMGRSGPSARISPSSGMVSTQPAGGGRRLSGRVTPSTSSGLRTTGTSGRDPAGRFWDQRSPARRETAPRFPLRRRSSTTMGRSGPSARISPSSGMVSTQPAGGGRRLSGRVTPSTSSGLRTTGTSGRDPAGRFWEQRSPARRETAPRFPLRRRSSTTMGRSGPSARISPSSGMVSTQPAGGGRRLSGGITPSTSSGLRTTGTSGRDPAGRFWEQRSPAVP